MRCAWLLVVACLLLVPGCGQTAPSPQANRATSPGGGEELTHEPRRDPDPSLPLVVFLGDSLSAGYGLSQEEAFPALLAELLAEGGQPARVVNAGVSGDTSAGGLRRLPWLLKQAPDLVVVELGGNDGLRGLPVEHTAENLRRIVELCHEAGSQVLLLGIQVPPNYGPDYAQKFAAIFPRLAEELGVPLVPFLLEGVGGQPELNLPDGIHPTAEGHEIVARNVLPYLQVALGDPRNRSPELSR